MAIVFAVNCRASADRRRTICTTIFLRAGRRNSFSLTDTSTVWPRLTRRSFAEMDDATSETRFYAGKSRLTLRRGTIVKLPFVFAHNSTY